MSFNLQTLFKCDKKTRKPNWNVVCFDRRPTTSVNLKKRNCFKIKITSTFWKVGVFAMMKLHKIFICNFWCLEGKCCQNKNYLSSYNDDSVFMPEGNKVETWKMQQIESLLSLYVLNPVFVIAILPRGRGALWEFLNWDLPLGAWNP